MFRILIVLARGRALHPASHSATNEEDLVTQRPIYRLVSPGRASILTRGCVFGLFQELDFTYYNLTV